MLFLSLSTVEVNFIAQELNLKSYIIATTVFSTTWIELVGIKDFIAATLDPNVEIFVVQIAFLKSSGLSLEIYSFSRDGIAFLKADEAPTFVYSKNADFTNVFSKDLVAKLPKQIKINLHVMELVEDQQPLYELIYRPRLVALEALKTKIKTNLAIGFIKSSKFTTSAFILFVKKYDSSFHFYVHYRTLKNIFINNYYSLHLILKSLDWLDWAKSLI